MQKYPLTYAPDMDTCWDIMPGAVSVLSNFAPLELGAYGSADLAAVYATATVFAGTDIMHAQMLRKVSGSVRFMVFRRDTIDEHDAGGNRTQRYSGAGATVGAWAAVSWGDQIIATNGKTAPITIDGTSASFTVLAGSPPYCQLIAANINFVMLANNTDPTTPIYDEVYWSGLRNPLTWTPSLATQAGKQRLLDTPGPIVALTAFRDFFVAFKKDSFYIGQYVGAQNFIFSWRVISTKIGCSAAKSVVECDGKLFFMHTSGFYSFDGQTLQNVGLPIFQSFLANSGYIQGNNIGGAGIPSNYEGDLSKTTATADDRDGVVWWLVPTRYQLNGKWGPSYMYGLNVRTGKWGRYLSGVGVGATTPPVMVQASSSEVNDFTLPCRFLMVNADILYKMSYPAAGTGLTFTTGLIGNSDRSSRLLNIGWRTLPGTSATAVASVSVAGYASENMNIQTGSDSGAVNQELDQGDVVISSRFNRVTVTFTAGKTVILSGIGAGKDTR